jgi:hypothetical protein
MAISTLKKYDEKPLVEDSIEGGYTLLSNLQKENK